MSSPPGPAESLPKAPIAVTASNHRVNLGLDGLVPWSVDGLAHPLPPRVGRPDGPEPTLLLAITPSGDRRAGRVGVVPSLAVQRRSHRPAAGHLEMAVGVRLADPVPGVAQPVGAVLLALVREPGDLVVAPDPDAARLRLARLPAGAPVVESPPGRAGARTSSRWASRRPCSGRRCRRRTPPSGPPPAACRGPP